MTREGGAFKVITLLFIFQTLFVAHGPAFRKEAEVEHFQNTELYDMMAGTVDIHWGLTAKTITCNNLD